MRKRTVRALLIAALLCASNLPSYAWLDASKSTFSAKEMDMRTNMRELLSEYITWERIFVIETLTGAPDVAAAQTRFIASQDDICRVFTLYYGDYTGSKMNDLFKQYNQLITDYATAEKNRSGKAFININKLYDKVDEIANLLSMANMNWTKKDLLDQLKQYSDFLTAEIDKQGNVPGSIDAAALDATFTASMSLADTFSGGIVQQFPAKFW